MIFPPAVVAAADMSTFDLFLALQSLFLSEADAECADPEFSTKNQLLPAFWLQ